MNRIFTLLLLLFSVHFLPAQCVLNAEIDITCDDNGTPENAGDDTFEVFLTVLGEGMIDSFWIVPESSIQGFYYTPRSLGTYSANESFTINIQDQGNADCQLSIDIMVPSSCSSYIDLELDKSVDNPNAGIGETVNFNIEVCNSGTGEATGIQVEDLLPSGFQYLSSTISGDHVFTNSDGIFRMKIEDIGNLREGEEFCQEVYVQNFLDIIGLQFTIEYDPAHLEFLSVGAFNLPWLVDSLFGRPDDPEAEVNPGFLSFSWFDRSFNGVTLADGSSMFEICFRVITDANINTNLNFNNSINPIEIVNSNEQVLSFDVEGSILLLNNESSYDPETGIWNIEQLLGGACTNLEIEAMVTDGGNYVNLAEVIALNETDFDSTPGNGVDTNGNNVFDNDPGDEDDGDGATVFPCNCQRFSNNSIVCEEDGRPAFIGVTCPNGGGFDYLWSNGATDSVLMVNTPGTYCLTISLPGACESIQCFEVFESDIQATILVQPIDCNNYILEPANFYSPFSTLRWFLPDGRVASGRRIIADQEGWYIFRVIDASTQCQAADSVFLSSEERCINIRGKVFEDLGNCSYEFDEITFADWQVRFNDGNTTYLRVTDENGMYSFDGFPGVYTVEVLPPNLLWAPACMQSYSVDASEPTSEIVLDLPVKKVEACPLLRVDIATNFLRRCALNQYTVFYCNEGSTTAEGAFVTLQLDPDLSYFSSQIPLASDENGLLTFNLGDIPLNFCGSFWVKVQLDCNVELGQTHCIEAQIFPDSLCLPPSSEWSGASLRLEGTCQDEQFQIKIENIGEGNMLEPRQFIVIEDGILLRSEERSIQLDQGGSLLVNLPANGSTYRAEVMQVSNHPGRSMPSLVTEGCGQNDMGTFSLGFFNNFPLDDANPQIDFDCRPNVGSFDPNIKSAFPKGYDQDHFINPNVDLEYEIKFQNTGTDTAFYVQIRDTLSPFLDMTTVRVGASSHPYSWNIDSSNILVFTFDPIALPDSNVNEPASNGFIKFRISQIPDVPPGSVIFNRAGIYFDQNEPVITNRTFHTIGNDFMRLVSNTNEVTTGLQSVLVFPNPTRESARIELLGTGTSKKSFQLFDLYGRLLKETAFWGSQHDFKREKLPSGVYWFQIKEKGRRIASGKLVMK